MVKRLRRIRAATPKHLPPKTLRRIAWAATPVRRLYVLRMLNVGMQPNAAGQDDRIWRPK
jgi:hypothetical protein